MFYGVWYFYMFFVLQMLSEPLPRRRCCVHSSAAPDHDFWLSVLVNTVSFESQALTLVSQKHSTVLIGAVESKEPGMVEEVLARVKDNLSDEEVRKTPCLPTVSPSRLNRQLRLTLLRTLAPLDCPLVWLYLQFSDRFWFPPKRVSLEPGRLFGRYGPSGTTISNSLAGEVVNRWV